MNDGNLVVHESTDIQLADERVNQANTLSPLVMAAMDKNLDTDKLNQLLDIQAKFEAMEAEKAYNRAMAEFKKNPPKVLKDMTNTQFNSKYSSKGNLLNTVNPYLAEHGLSSRFDIKQTDSVITVTCIITHAMGHSERVTMSAPPDKSGAKNPIQQIKSTKTYLEIATFESAVGVSASNDGDDDGNGYMSDIEYITAEEEADLISLIEDVGANSKLFLKFLKIDEYSQLPRNKLKAAISKLEQKRKANA